MMLPKESIVASFRLKNFIRKTKQKNLLPSQSLPSNATPEAEEEN